MDETLNYVLLRWLAIISPHVDQFKNQWKYFQLSVNNNSNRSSKQKRNQKNKQAAVNWKVF